MDERTVAVELPDTSALTGDLTIPEGAHAVVLFAHGSGSSRHSPRNRGVAQELQRHGLATMLIDLLTPEEALADATTRQFRFDIEMLADRLEVVTRWFSSDSAASALRLGYFGASTGAAAALVAAAHMRDQVGAVVSRGGRPDLAGPALRDVTAPTLLIVGGRDAAVLDLNRQALADIGDHGHLEIVPGATHLFEEPGALATVSSLAVEWFGRHLGR